MHPTRTIPHCGPYGAGHARAPRVARWLPVLFALACAMAVLVARPSGADQVASLQNQAASLAHQLVLSQLQADSYRQAASMASARVTKDEQEMARLNRQIGSDQQAIDAKLRIVRTQAILSYINSGAGNSGVAGALFGNNSGVRAQAASEYASLAAGSITTTIAQLHTAQAALQDQRTALRQRQSQDTADQAARDHALAQVSVATSRLAAAKAQITGQLAAAVTAQQAAMAQRAAAAVVTTSAPPAHTTSTQATPGPAPTATVATIPNPSAPAAPAPVSRGTGPSVSDPPLPPFLQCVIQAESGGNYQIASPGGTYMGAFQFSQSTWNSAARSAGLGYLVGVPPNAASRAEQDTVAVTLYNLAGRQPWLGDRCSA